MNKEAHEQLIKAKLVEQEEIRVLREEMFYNFRLWLLESFVRINQWDHVEDIIGRIYSYKLDLSIHRPLLTAMFEALEWFITPIYQSVTKAVPIIGKKQELTYYFDSKKHRAGQIRQATNSKILYEDLPLILRCIGVNIAFNERIFQKVVVAVERTKDENIEKAR